MLHSTVPNYRTIRRRQDSLRYVRYGHTEAHASSQHRSLRMASQTVLGVAGVDIRSIDGSRCTAQFQPYESIASLELTK